MNNHPPQTPIQPRRRMRALVAIILASALIAGAVAFGAWSRLDAGAPKEPPLTGRMQNLVDAGFPSVLASVTEASGERIDVAVGQGELETNIEPPVDGEVRIGSNTKMYVATIVLQLVEEGSLELDDPIDDHLPGLLTGAGITGADITVQALLQHTSGLPEYAVDIAAEAFAVQNSYFAPRTLLDLALDKPASFQPGERWEYSNTNYLVLGLLIEKLTSKVLHEQIQERIIAPLGLEHSYMPVPGDRSIHGAHPHGYHQDSNGELRDITEMDPSFAWAAGSMVTSPSDLNRFTQALLNGELLNESSLAAMKSSVPAGDGVWPGGLYGLGLQGFPLSCGGVAWGHGGDIPGTQTRNAVGPDGTAVTIAVTALPWGLVDMTDEQLLQEKYKIVVDALDQTLCDG